MSKHDTWATVTKDSLLAEPAKFSPKEEIPLRDPFPLLLNNNGQITVDLYLIDIERLEFYQYIELRAFYNFFLRLSDEGFTEYIRKNGGFPVHMNLISQKFYGAESYQRMIEFMDFIEENPEPSKQKYITFCEDQYNRWIIGNEEPSPLPKTFEEYDPRFQTSELGMALVKRQIEKELADYSYLNVPTVKPSFDFLNQVDSNDSDELIDLDEIFGDD